MTAVKSPFRILLVALGLGYAVDLLFYGHTLGVSALLFVLLMLAALLGVSRMERVSLERRNLWLVEPLLFFAGMIFVRANVSLTWMNSVAALVLLGLLIYFLAADHVERLGLLGYPAVLAIALGRAFAEPVPPVGLLAAEASVHKERVRLAAPLLRGLLMALPLLILFTLLLASADLFFADYINNLLSLDFARDLPQMLLHLALILIAAWVCAGALYFALSRQRSPELRGELYELPGSVHFRRTVGFLEGATVLALVDLLFAAFAWTQFAYLFSGEAARKLGYEAYREYVRQGFGQLLLVSLLAMALILGLRTLARPENNRQIRAFNALSTAMICLALVMLVSAFWRMLVWENIQFYINTPLRIYIRVFVIFLGLLFLWLLFTMWIRSNRFAIGAFVAALAFLVTVNIVNPDADVAAYNLAHRDDDLATRYLSLLSDDAVPALVQGLRESSGFAHESIAADLQRRLDGMERDRGWQSWQSFHFARWEAYGMLRDLRAQGQLCCEVGSEGIRLVADVPPPVRTVVVNGVMYYLPEPVPSAAAVVPPRGPQSAKVGRQKIELFGY